jgi:glycosyltransferase involved in cell wall biosynthesis
VRDSTVSAVIPVYNGADHVAEAIDSVLAQTHPVVECLVIDDGSTDATPDVVTTFGAQVRYVRVPRAGQSNARNHGIDLARGELVAFLDHDDAWMPSKLERQLQQLHSQPGATLVLCGIELVDPVGTTLGTSRLLHRDRESLIRAMLMFDGSDIPGCNQAALVRRDWLLDHGGYDIGLSVCGDWDLLLRTLLTGSLAYLDEPLVRYRLRDSGLHRNIRVMECDMRRAVGKAFADPRLPVTIRARRRHAYARMYRMLAGSYRDVGQRKAMVHSIVRSLSYDPTIGVELLTRLGRRASIGKGAPR